MLRIFYISAAKRLITASELSDLLAISRERNAADKITGVLLYNDGSFAQALEGPGEAVRACFARIVSDQRHSGYVKILEEQTTDRYFEGWPLVCGLAQQLSQSEQHHFMTLDELQTSPQFKAAQENLILKSFLTSFLSKWPAPSKGNPEKPQRQVRTSTFPKTKRRTVYISNKFINARVGAPANDHKDHPAPDLHSIKHRPGMFRFKLIHT